MESALFKPTPARLAPFPLKRAGLLATCAALLACSAVGGEARLWTSSDGKTLTAELIGATATTVTIKTDAGREFTLPHERLSQADREIIQAYLAQKQAEIDAIVWPEASASSAIKAAQFKQLHGIDPKKHAELYAKRMLLIEGVVQDVKQDRMSATQGVIVVLDTGDKIPLEFRILKSSYEKDLTLLLGDAYNRYRGPYGEDEFRVSVVDQSLVVERRYVTGREYDYNYSTGNYRNRDRWSSWEVVARPVSRGESVKLRGEFVSVFNSVALFKDARLIDTNAAPVTRSVVR